LACGSDWEVKGDGHEGARRKTLLRTFNFSCAKGWGVGGIAARPGKSQGWGNFLWEQGSANVGHPPLPAKSRVALQAASCPPSKAAKGGQPLYGIARTNISEYWRATEPAKSGATLQAASCPPFENREGWGNRFKELCKQTSTNIGVPGAAGQVKSGAAGCIVPTLENREGWGNHFTE
jgi:hypothetical protein